MHLRVLENDVQQFDKVPNHLAGRDVGICPDPAEFDLQKQDTLLLRQRRRIPEQLGVDFRQLFCQHQQFLIGQGVQVDHRSQHIPHALLCKTSLCQTGTESLIAVHAAACVLDALGCTTHDDAQILCLALHGVVVHGEDLFIVVLAGNAVGNFVDVHQFVDQHQHAAVAGFFQEHGEQLDILVPVVVGDNDVHAQFRPGFSLGIVFPAEPLDHLCLAFVVALSVGVVVQRQQSGKVKPVHHFMQCSDDLVDFSFHSFPELRVVGVQTGFRGSFALDVADPAIQNQRQCTAVRTCLGGHVPNQLFIGCQPLSLGAL